MLYFKNTYFVVADLYFKYCILYFVFSRFWVFCTLYFILGHLFWAQNTCIFKIHFHVFCSSMKAGRFVLGLRKYDNVKAAMSTDLKWLFPKYSYYFDVLKLAYNILCRNCPPYFYDYLNYDESLVKSTRGKRYLQSNVNSPLDKSFVNRARQLWLGMPT